MTTKELVNKKITIKKLPGALEQATMVIDKNYMQYDKMTKSDMTYDFACGLFKVLEGQLRDSDEVID